MKRARLKCHSKPDTPAPTLTYLGSIFMFQTSPAVLLPQHSPGWVVRNPESQPLLCQVFPPKLTAGFRWCGIQTPALLGTADSWKHTAWTRTVLFSFPYATFKTLHCLQMMGNFLLSVTLYSSFRFCTSGGCGQGILNRGFYYSYSFLYLFNSLHL